MSGTGQYGGHESTPVPENYRAIAQLVAGFVDDKIAEFRAEVSETLESHRAAIVYNGQRLDTQAATIGGLRDAMVDADARMKSNESMPEHVYKQFIRAEAERLRLIKPIRIPNPHSAPSSTTDPNTDT